ncbi:Neurotransmitter-gated ion-channel transmembrane region, partial [Cichlidogyrus casuarinus]
MAPNVPTEDNGVGTKTSAIKVCYFFPEAPIDVEVELVVDSFDKISEVDMDYTITIVLIHYWIDERLAFAPNDPQKQMTLAADFSEKIWVPDTFFANDKESFLHDITEPNKMVRLYGNGQIFYGMRFTTTLSCNMDLHYYPLDEQNCTVELESYGYTTDDVVMKWKKGRKSVYKVEKMKLPQFTLMDYHVHIYNNGALETGITTVLTMTTISTSVRSNLPRISYVKAIDIYIVTCFAFVFTALLEYAAVNYSYWGELAKQKTKNVGKRASISSQGARLSNSITKYKPASHFELENTSANRLRENGVVNTRFCFNEPVNNYKKTAHFTPLDRGIFL